MRSIAIVRGVSATFARALARVAPDPAIDVDLARAQHGAYVAKLRELGVEVIELPADDRFPDGCFVEDCAVVVDGIAVVTNPGAPSRRGEVVAVAEALRPYARLVTMRPPATLDGGDCLRVGSRLFVGMSARTNGAGVETLAATFASLGVVVTGVAMGDALHLKSVCAPIGVDRVVVAKGALPERTFAGVETVDVPAAEAYAANVVTFGAAALVSDGYPVTAELVAAAGFEVHLLDMSEMRKADGALTCLSIRLVA